METHNQIHPSPTQLAALALGKLKPESASKLQERVSRCSSCANFVTDTPRDAMIGLLLRMHLGWGHEKSDLEQGLTKLGADGPQAKDAYFNYYATQAMYHWGGRAWNEWNTKMRDQLVESQTAAGQEAGSWHWQDPWVAVGGRIDCTAMAALTLEIYYRHPPDLVTASLESE